MLQISPKQNEFLHALVSKKYRYLMYGGAMGGGKSFIACLAIISAATDFPKTRYAIVRKNLTTLKRTTFQTFKKVAELLGVEFEYNMAEMYATSPTGSVIYFLEADVSKDPDFNKFKGLELTAAVIDEANEIDERAFNILMVRIGRCNDNGEPAFILLTCNPSQNWVKFRFYDKWVQNTIEAPYYYLPALPKDNPFLSKDYILSLEDLPEAEYKRYALGDWNFSDDPSQLIKYEWIIESIVDDNQSITKLAVDVARFGDDRTVFAYGSENGLARIEIYNHQDTATTAEMIIQKCEYEKIGWDNVSVDVVGLGAGVVDHCHSKRFHVGSFSGGEKPGISLSHFDYRNMRAAAYWKLREKLQNRRFKLIDNHDLVKELSNIRYTVKEKTIAIEEKSEIKKRLGKSPDIADAVSMLCNMETPNLIITTGANVFKQLNPESKLMSTFSKSGF